MDDVPVAKKNSHTHSPLLLDHIRYELIAKLVTTSEETPVGFLLNKERTNGSILEGRDRTLWKEEKRERQGQRRRIV